MTTIRAAGATNVMAQTDTGHLDEIARLVDAGTVKPMVEEVVPLAEAARAHARLEAGVFKGKVVLQVVRWGALPAPARTPAAPPPRS